jgi:transposase
MSAPRRRFGTEQKATILKRYLVDRVPISDLCDEYGIKPNQVYTWQKILVDNLEAIFHPTAKRAASKVSVQEEKIARLEAKLQQKNEVISELMEENVRAKQEAGELQMDAGFPTTPATKSSIACVGGTSGRRFPVKRHGSSATTEHP